MQNACKQHFPFLTQSWVLGLNNRRPNETITKLIKSHFCLFESNQLFTLFTLKEKIQLQQNHRNYYYLVWIMCLEYFELFSELLYYILNYFIFMPIRIRILIKAVSAYPDYKQAGFISRSELFPFPSEKKRNFIPQIKPLDPQDFTICTITHSFCLLGSFFLPSNRTAMTPEAFKTLTQQTGHLKNRTPWACGY